MQTKHRHLCVYRKDNSVCIRLWHYLTMFMKLYPACLMQKARSRAAQAEPADVYSPYWVWSSHSLFRGYALYKRTPPPMLLSCAALFMPGLLLAFLTSEISQDKFWEISRFWSLKDILHRSPDCTHKSSKMNLGRHKLDNTVLLCSSPTQVEIIWDWTIPLDSGTSLKGHLLLQKRPQKPNSLFVLISLFILPPLHCNH